MHLSRVGGSIFSKHEGQTKSGQAHSPKVGPSVPAYIYIDNTHTYRERHWYIDVDTDIDRFIDMHINTNTCM